MGLDVFEASARQIVYNAHMRAARDECVHQI